MIWFQVETTYVFIDKEYDVFIGKFDKLLILKLREKTLFKLKCGNRVKYYFLFVHSNVIFS